MIQQSATSETCITFRIEITDKNHNFVKQIRYGEDDTQMRNDLYSLCLALPSGYSLTAFSCCKTMSYSGISTYVEDPLFKVMGQIAHKRNGGEK